MEYKIEGNILVAKLDHEEDFFESLEKIMSEIEQKSAMVATAIGMLKDFSLGFYNMETGEYEFKEYDEPMELVSVHVASGPAAGASVRSVRSRSRRFPARSRSRGLGRGGLRSVGHPSVPARPHRTLATPARD